MLTINFLKSILNYYNKLDTGANDGKYDKITKLILMGGFNDIIMQ